MVAASAHRRGRMYAMSARPHQALMGAGVCVRPDRFDRSKRQPAGPSEEPGRRAASVRLAGPQQAPTGAAICTAGPTRQQVVPVGATV